MKKIISSVFAFGMMALALTSCEDVPAPFDITNNGGQEEQAIEPAGDGTQASPYNVASALKIGKDGTYTSDKVYIKGVITNIKEIDTGNYGNATYSIGDTKDAKTTFLIYRGLGLGGAKFKTGQEITVGDTVVVLGEITNFNGTLETKQGSQIVSINGKTDPNGGGSTGGNDSNASTATPTGDGTAASPYNVAKAQSVLASLTGDTPSDSVYIEGTVVGTPEINTQYGNATYFLADGTSGKLSVYRGNYLKGGKFTATDQLKEGDKVVIYGKLINYKGNTPQVNMGSKMISLNGKTEPENGGSTGGSTTNGLTIEGTTVTATNTAVTAGTTTATIDLNTIGQENATDATTYTLSDGSTITFGTGTNTTTPKFYTATKGVRLYANNTITIAGKAQIAKVVFTCDAYNGTNYVGNTTATLIFDGNNATYTNVHSANSGGVQLRVQTITITYAN